jgi:hypothetical protein
MTTLQDITKPLKAYTTERLGSFKKQSKKKLLAGIMLFFWVIGTSIKTTFQILGIWVLSAIGIAIGFGILYGVLKLGVLLYSVLM